MKTSIAIHWFRRDLRLADNPSLMLASQHTQVLPVYILDDKNAGDWHMGGASRWWLHHSLQALNQALDGKLNIYVGRAEDIITSLCERFEVEAVYWNRCYEPWRMRRDAKIKASLHAKGIHAQSANGSLLWEPWRVCQRDGSPYQVFSPFYRKGCLKAEPPRLPLPAPASLSPLTDQARCSLDSLGLLPKIPWDQQLVPHWEIGEQGAQNRLSQFIAHSIDHYKEGRNQPAEPFVSRLSPYLHFGEISPHQVWHAIRQQGANKHTEHFCSELGWREFSYHLLFHQQDLPTKNLQPQFDRYPWQTHSEHLQAWQTGNTGIPFVDAGMRELWQTGYMHNRVRMVVGSFLTKNLMIDWREGERWFWDTLVDADLANNSASWQWIAGCGADPAPYFRIFNPVSQAQKFDPNGDYIRRYVPELSELPNDYIHQPWSAPALLLQASGITLGQTYPKPIVDIKASRDDALAVYEALSTPNEQAIETS
ncbi:MAG: cryptochrome/photolyase family protein [Pontibacterium sp.]